VTKSPTAASPAAPPAFAIVGFAGRFPGANDVDTFWANLKAGVESRTVFTDQDMLDAGIPEAMLAHPKLVRAGFVLDDVEMFDAAFFGFNPRETELLDPQHRLFLECAWQAMEHAGYEPDAVPGPVGIFGGATLGSYLPSNVLRNSEVVKNVGLRTAVYGSVPDYMVTRVAYKLNLRGPAMFVQSACSTSLVAVHLACRSLAAGECDMAMAGGVSVQVPHRGGYAYEDGSMMSPDGVCRTFDANARGTVFGNGVGLVVIKRLEDALADGDTVHAIIRGTAANNDGSLKVGFTAPGVAGQARVIELALEAGNLSADSISYVEAHGTGTELGDPIEIAALTRAYRAHTDRSQFCAVGSVKPNIGHLDAAAGVSSLIKTVMALKHRQLPPTINFDKPNPKIDFEDSPFFVNTTLREWDANGGPRRAGVSSFGFGGTNGHVIVEEAPEPAPPAPSRAAQLLVLTARTESALNLRTQHLAEFLQRRQCDTADAAYTLAVGRKSFGHRTAVVCAAGDDPVDMLQGRDARRVFTGYAPEKDRPVVLMFPGQGAQYVNMGRDLYRDEPLFRQTVDACAERLHPVLGADIRTVMYPEDAADPVAAELLRQTAFTQSALFTIEYALATLWMSWGIKPAAMIGHSIGELVAACVAGVFTLDDALALVATRGRLMEEMPTGTMAAVPLPGDQVARLIGSNLWLAAINGPSLSVVAGSADAVDEFVEARAREGVECRKLHTSHAFHSGLMEPAVERFAEAVRRVERRPPSMPFISNLTGTWITAEQATDPNYWASHIRQPVRFADGAATLLAEGDRLLLECGPGNTLSALVRQQAASGRSVVVSSLRHPQEQTADLTTMLSALGRLWVAGAAVDWHAFYAGERRRRVPLPTYPFERQRFWIEPEKTSRRKLAMRLGLSQREDRSEWFHVVSWKHTMTPSPLSMGSVSEGRALLFEPAGVDCSPLVERLQASGRKVLRVRAGERFARVDDTTWIIAPDSREDHAALVKAIAASGPFPDVVAHAWSLAAGTAGVADDSASATAQKQSFYSLIHLAQALGSAGVTAPVTLGIVTNGVHDVTGNEPLVAENATVVGPFRVIPAEFPNVTCRHFDLSIDEVAKPGARALDLVGIDLLTAGRDQAVAYRQGRRWVQGCEGVRLEPVAEGQNPRLRKQGVYFITGGYGGIGLVLAEHLAEHYQARIVLTGRRPFPPREAWAEIVARNPEDATARRIQAVQKLEALGAEVMTGVADATDEAATRAVVEQAIARFGRIDGVIHSAGVAGGGIIQMKKTDVAAAVLAPKVYGSRILARAFRDQKLDFLLLCSSMASLVGGFGQVDYCSANAYLDTFARAFARETGTFTVAVNWNAWREVGMAVDTSVPEDLRESLKGAVMSSGIPNREGIDAFERILARATESQIAISPNDLGILAIAMAIPEEEKVSAPVARPAAEQSSGAASAPSAKASSYHPRPPLPTPYVPPTSEVEKQLCAIWQDLLGIDKVGVNDNFFELGGHSLLAISVMARVNKTLNTDVPVAKLYDGLTVAFLAAAIAPQEQQAEPEQDAESDERRRDRARRQREQQARRRGMREMSRT
jgi:acyl transferase domain-containing protein